MSTGARRRIFTFTGESVQPYVTAQDPTDASGQPIPSVSWSDGVGGATRQFRGFHRWDEESLPVNNRRAVQQDLQARRIGGNVTVKAGRFGKSGKSKWDCLNGTN